MKSASKTLIYVCADPGVPVFGTKGCSIHVQEVLRAFKKRGYQPILLAARLGGDPSVDLQDICVYKLPTLPPQVSSEFLASVDDLGAQTTHILDLIPRKTLIYERQSLWSFRAMEYGQNNGIPTILEVNAPLVYEQQLYRSMHHPDLATAICQRSFDATSQIIAVSKGVKSSISRDYNIKTSVDVIHNGVDIVKFSPPPPAQPLGSSKCLSMGLVFSGSLKPWHGLYDFLDIFAAHLTHHHQTSLTIIGDGPERAVLEEKAKQLSISTNVVFTGAVSQDEVPIHLSRSSVALAPYPNLPNMYFSPLKIFEYMAIGLCTVAPRIGDIPTILEHGNTGILYDPTNPLELKSILDALNDDQELISRIGRNARAHACTCFSWDTRIDQIIKLVDQQRVL